jgi:hypothetical protein
MDIAWNNYKKYFLKKYHPLTCAICDTHEKRELHHIKPFKDNHNLFQDDSNIIVLCREHHFTYGHMRNWQYENDTLLENLQNYRKFILQDKYFFKIPKNLEVHFIK